MKWFVPGDIDGFFGLALDNLIQVLVVISLCGGLLGYPHELLFGKLLPAMAVSLILGNLAYAYMAVKIGRSEGRDDVCSLPYGINTPSVFIYIFLVMLPVKLAAMADGLDEASANTLSWQAGLLACLGSGVIELLGAFIAERVRKSAPRAALLSTLSGVALGFISLPFLFRTFAQPLVGFTTLAILLLIFFGQVKFRGRLPGGLITVTVGIAMAWLSGLAPGEGDLPALHLAWPEPVPTELFAALKAGFLTDYLNVIIPMAAFNIVGSLQNIESAAAAGDAFPTRLSLGISSIGTIAAALFGSPFPTTIYIGHPGWKALGARAGYSVLNAFFMTGVCLSGAAAAIAWAVPVESGMAIVLWIGIFITAQAFQVSDAKHAPAVVLGVMLGVGAFGSFMLKAGMRAADIAMGGTMNWQTLKEPLTKAFASADVAITGAFALEQGVIFSAMIFSALTSYVIDRNFRKAAYWCLLGSGLSATGLMHSFTWAPKDAPMTLSPAWQWSIAYFLMALIFFSARWTTEQVDKKNS